MDIDAFLGRFNKHSALFRAQPDTLYSAAYSYGEKYEIILTPRDSEYVGGEILLCCVCDSEGRIGEVSVTIALENEKKPDTEAFDDASRAAATAFTEYSGETSDKAFERLLPAYAEGYSKPTRLYFETNVYLYSFCVNPVGVRFSVENKQVAPQSETVPTLRIEESSTKAKNNM